MQGSLALASGTLYVGMHAKTARVRAFDLGGRELAPAFSFKDPMVGRSAVSGLAVDEDHAILVADTPADRVRRFTVFGREIGGIGVSMGAGDAPGPVLPGLVVRPRDVEVRGNAGEGWVAIACGGEERHAVQLFDPDFSYRASFQSMGESGGRFGSVVRLAADGEALCVAESSARRVQVFRSEKFLFAFQLTNRAGEFFEPSAIAAVGDGRMVVGCRAPQSALFLVDQAGRPVRLLAGEGESDGCVVEPTDAVLEPGECDARARLFVIDRDGLRIQVFTLEGGCLGSFSMAASLADDASLRRSASSSRGNKGGR